MYAGTASDGEEFTVTSRVTNLTDSPQNYNAVLWLNSETYMTRSVLIPGGLTKEIRFELTLPADTYDLRLGRIARTVTVKSSQQVATAVPVVTAVAQPTISKPATSATPISTAKPVATEQATPVAAPTELATAIPTAIAAPGTTGGGFPIMILVGVVVVLALLGIGFVFMKGRGGNGRSED